MANKPLGNRNGKFRSNRNTKGNNQKAGVRTTKRLVKPNKNKVQDARQKILQKQRKTVVDARDILSKMAKTQDARSKLNKIRENRSGTTTNNGNVRTIGTHIVRKTDRNGKISLSTNKSKSPASMNVTIQKQLGLIQASRPQHSNQRSNQKRSPISRRDPLVLKSMLNDLEYRQQSLQPLRMIDTGMYKWTKPNIRPTASQVISSLEARRRQIDDELLSATARNWPTYSIERPVSEYIDLDAVVDEEMPLVSPIRQTIALQGSSRISNVHSRLDALPTLPESHGILSQPKTKVVLPAGHRIVVSNLQASVSQDDIKELFEDIGQLLAARLVRPGVAEVIYKNLKDAQKAVDTYHNRQLDGQPMKCLLVNKRPFNNPTAPAILKLENTGGLLSRKVPTPNVSNKLVPDISTIHKVLFQRK